MPFIVLLLYYLISAQHLHYSSMIRCDVTQLFSSLQHFRLKLFTCVCLFLVYSQTDHNQDEHCVSGRLFWNCVKSLECLHPWKVSENMHLHVGLGNRIIKLYYSVSILVFQPKQ